MIAKRLGVRQSPGAFMQPKSLSDVPAFITKDGSEIRELLAHRNSAIRNQSLAEARVPVGGSTMEHYHGRTEEIYFITAGTGRIRRDLGDSRRSCTQVARHARAQQTGEMRVVLLITQRSTVSLGSP